MSVGVGLKDIDLNSLFNLSLNYNFDILKNVIEGLMLNQKEHDEKIKDLVDKDIKTNDVVNQ